VDRAGLVFTNGDLSRGVIGASSRPAFLALEPGQFLGVFFTRAIPEFRLEEREAKARLMSVIFDDVLQIRATRFFLALADSVASWSSVIFR